MKNTTKLLLGGLALVLILGGAYAALNLRPADPLPEPPPSESAPQKPDVIQAPDFKMTDAEGNLVQLSDYRGKPVLLNFWASWCGPCRIEMPHFQAAFDELGEDIAFLMVNLEDASTAAKFIGDGGFTFPYYVDHKQEGAMAYAVASIPRTYAIDAEGNLVKGVIGTLDEKALGQLIDLLIKD